MVAAQKGDYRRTILRHSDHRRLGAFVLETWCRRTDKNSAGAEADDGAAFVETFRKMCCRLGISDVAFLSLRRVNFASDLLFDFLRKRQGRWAENEDDRCLHRTFLLAKTRMVEKYGTAFSSTSATGRMRSASRVA